MCGVDARYNDNGEKLVNKMDIFKGLIKALTPFLKQMGFNKKGNNFYLETNKNYGVINLQKSRDCTKEVIKFTINFGVYSNILGQALDYAYNNLTKPDIWQCQWQSRVGSFMAGKPDYWWNVNALDNFNIILFSVMEAIQNIVVPELNKRLDDEGLIINWMNGTYGGGTTEISRFEYLTTLLKEKRDFNTLNQVVKTFMQQSKGKPNASRAIEHLKEIGVQLMQ